MTRIIITGKNCDLSRETFSRAARLACFSSQETGRAASSSGTTPDAAAGGTRAPDDQENRSPDTQSLCDGPESPQTFRLGALRREEWWAIYFFIACALFSFCLTLGGVWVWEWLT